MKINNKEKIAKFLKKNKEKQYSLTAIALETKISYPSVLRWVDVLLLEDKRFKCMDYGNVKLISFQGNKKREREKK